MYLTCGSGPFQDVPYVSDLRVRAISRRAICRVISRRAMCEPVWPSGKALGW